MDATKNISKLITDNNAQQDELVNLDDGDY